MVGIGLRWGRDGLLGPDGLSRNSWKEMMTGMRIRVGGVVNGLGVVFL